MFDTNKNTPSIISAINSSQAIVEFDIDARVINANQNFLSIFDYTIEEIKGKHHSIFAEESYVNSDAYKVFWDRLLQGRVQSGQFKRLTKYGQVVWIQAVYTPILNEFGHVEKVIKLAMDITQDKALSLYYQGQIEGIAKTQAIVEFNPLGIVLDANPIFLDTFGYSLDEIQGQPHSIFCEDSFFRSNEYKYFWEDLKAGHYRTGQYKRMTKFGMPVWIQASYNPIYGVDGKVVRIIKYAHNISEEKERSIHNEGMLDAISKSQAVIEFNKNGVVLSANKNFLKIFNYSNEEIIGKHHSIFCEKHYVDSDDYKLFWESLTEGAYQTGQFKRLDKNGNILWMQAAYNPIYGLDGKIVKIIKFASDITKEKEQSLYFQGQVEAINRSQAVIEFDANGVILTANNNFLTMFGYTLEDVIGCHHSIFCDEIYAESEEYHDFWHDLKHGVFHSGRFKRLHKNGQIVYIRATYNPIYGAAGKVIKVVKFAHDISESERESLMCQGKINAICSTQAYIEFDPKGEVIYANDNFLNALKYNDIEEIKGEHFSIFSDPEVAKSTAYKKWLSELLNGKHHVGQYKLIDKFGGTVWLHASYSPIYGIDGNIVKIVQFSSDITDKKEQELNNNGHIEAISKSQAVIEFDINGNVIDANANFLKIMDYDFSDIRGKHHSTFCTDAYVNAKAYDRFWKDLRAGKHKAGEFERLRSDGSIVWLSATYNPIVNIDGDVIKIVKYALDITKEKEKSLYYQGQIEAINKAQAVIEFDPDGIVLSANDNFLKAFHYHLDEIVGKHHSMFCEESLVNSSLYETIWNQLKRGKYHTGEYKRLDKNGQIVWIQASYNPIFDIDGKVIKIIKYAHDISEAKAKSLYYQGQIEAIGKSQAIVEYDVNGVILNANERFLDIFRYTIEEIRQKHHSLFVDKHYASTREYKVFWEQLKAGKHQSGQFKRYDKEGKLVWIRASYNPIYGIDGNVIKIVKYSHNITHDQELSLYNEGQVIAINKAQAVVEFDMNGTVLSANDNFLEAMNYTIEEVTGKHHSMFCEKHYIKSSQYHEFWDKLQRGLHDSGKYLRIGKNGKKVWIRATYTPILNVEGKPIRVLKYAQDITELETIKLDKLTGLYNSGKLISDIKLKEANNLAIINSNEYIEISDYYGFLAGDTLIVQFSKILSNLMRPDFELYRMHDDRFAILNHTLSREAFEDELKVIMRKTNTVRIDTKVNYLNLTLTCGVAYGESDEIVTFAKTAHNHAKNTKQSLIAYSKDLNIEEKFKNKIFWSQKIKSALEEDRVIVNYQAIYNNKTKEIDKYEVLVRTVERDHSLIYPNQFLDVAKTSKQYLSITKVVIIKAFEKFKDLPYEFSINMTIEDIMDNKLQEFFFTNVKKYGVGDRLVIEIVESEQIKQYAPISAFVKKLKEHGIKLAIDDFGSGYSNFSHLLELDADYVKIDGSIISKLDENNYSSEIIKSIVSFCTNMNIKVIAEYVSSEAIYNKVVELGVDASQGFYIGRPQEQLILDEAK